MPIEGDEQAARPQLRTVPPYRPNCSRPFQAQRGKGSVPATASMTGADAVHRRVPPNDRSAGTQLVDPLQLLECRSQAPCGRVAMSVVTIAVGLTAMSDS
jgi:hypothetical protein